MAKVVYLFGAGASMNAVPLAKDYMGKSGRKKRGFKKSLINFMNQTFEKPEIKNNHRFDIPNQHYKHVIKDIESFDTIDTCAKFYFNNGENHPLELMKNMINAYFYNHHLGDSFPEHRYMNLFTSIYDGTPKIEDDFLFLTYNYDFLLEKSIERVSKDYKLFSFKDERKNTVKHYPSIEEGWNYQQQFIVHLNGIAGMIKQGEEIISLHSKKTNRTQYYHLYPDTKTENLLKFGWEEDKNILNTLDFIAKQFESVETLIITGYSFPFFNRKYDNVIINNVCKSNKIRRIYIQNPTDTTDAFKQRFEIVGQRQIPVIHISDCEYHYIPYDL